MSTDPAGTTATGAALDRDLRPDRHQDLRRPRHRPREGHLGAVVVGSLAAGLLAAVALAAAPFVPVQMHVLTGVVLLGFALGSAVLGVLSVLLIDRPQRWAAAPAGVLALAGLVSLLPPGSLLPEVFGVGLAAASPWRSSCGRPSGRTGSCAAGPGGGWSTRCWSWSRPAAGTTPPFTRPRRS